MNTTITDGPWYWQDFGNGPCLMSHTKGRPCVLSASRGAKLLVLDGGRLIPLTADHPDAKLLQASRDMLDELKAMCARAEDQGWLLDGSGPAQDLLQTKSLIKKLEWKSE